MTDNQILNIYEESLRIKYDKDIFQACIHIAESYGLQNETEQLKRIYAQKTTNGDIVLFSNIYDKVCGKIHQQFGHWAWYHTLTFQLTDLWRAAAP